MNLDEMARGLEAVPYAQRLGVRVEEVSAERVRLRLPFEDENSNPGRALHGGVVASTIDMAGALVARAGVEERPGLDASTLDLGVSYLAAAIGEDIVASAEVLRRGKEIVYSQVDVRTDAGKRIAAGTSTYRIFDPSAVPAAAERQRSTVESAGPAGEPELLQGARLFMGIPFIARLGMRAEHARDGHARLSMPYQEGNADAGGLVHEGALAGLIDTSGALASWSITGLDFRYKASTVGIHVNFHGPVASEDVVALATTLRRNNEIFFNQVRVVTRGDDRLVADGTVIYRIVID